MQGARAALGALWMLVLAADAVAAERGSVVSDPPAASVGSEVASSEADAVAGSTTWYGWQSLTTDAAAVGLALAAVNLGSPDQGTLTVLSVSTYALGGPIVHLSHENPGRAGLSLVARVALPAAGLYAAYALLPSPTLHGDSPPAWPRVAIPVASVVAAMTLDAALLGYEEKQSVPRTQVSWTPTLQLTDERADIGVLGSF